MEVEVCVERERGRKRERREGEVVPKIYQRGNLKSSKNQPKIDQEETENPPKNQSKICQKSILEGSRGVFGGTWRPIPKNDGGTRFFGTLLGPSWPLAASWAVLAASWARLGGLGGLLGPSWARLGGRNRTPSRPNIDPKIDQNFDAFGDRLFGGFWWILGGKMEASWVQNRSKNRSQL